MKTTNTAPKAIVTWSRVRSFGQLRILARASLAVIVLVPILTSIWPAFVATGYGAAAVYQTGLSGGNAAVRVAQFAINSADSSLRSRPAGSCSAMASCDSLALLLSRSSQLLSHVERSIGEESTKGKSLQNLRLPHTLSLLYYASLFFFAGQIIYQLFAPRTVQQYNIEEFANTQVLAFEKGRGEAMLLKYCALLGRDRPPNESASEAFEIVQLGARLQYKLSEEKHRPAASAAALCFISASLLISCVLVRQALDVGRASGWF